MVGPVRIARFLPTGIEVTVEKVPARLRSHPAFAARLAESGQIASTLRSPHLVAVYDVVKDGDTLMVVGEVAEGRTLAEDLSAGATLPPATALRVVDDVLAALELAHGAGLAHGAVTRDTVLVAPDGRYRLGGLGLAGAVCAAEARECSPAGDLAAAARLGLSLLGMGDGEKPPQGVSRRTARLLEAAAAVRAPGSMSSAAGMRAVLAAAQGRAAAPQRERLARRRFLRVSSRIAVAVVPVAIGVSIGLALTAPRTNPRPAAHAFVVRPGVHLEVSPSSGGCGTRFLFTASGNVAGHGTLVYQWERSDGVVLQKRLSITAAQGGFLVTNAWTLSSAVSAPITMTLRVLSPTPMSVSHRITPACK
jgi:serine/threonine protein kinase